MSIQVAIRHTTRYRYDRPVALSPHVVRLRPAAHSRTPILAYTLKAEPRQHFINWQQDPFGNYLARLVFPERTRELLVDVEVIADMTVINPFDFFVEEYADNWPFGYPDALRKELAPYLEAEPAGPRLAAHLAAIDRTPRNIVTFLVELNQALQRRIGYTIRLEPGVQTPEETLELALGSCRDTGWLLVQALRHLGLAARFVSGYLVQLTPDEKSLDGPSGPEKDFTDLHAWAEVYVPGAGWIGLDPTSGLFAGEGHIPLACTPQPSSAAPIEGLSEKCEVEFSYRNAVTRFREDPRVTKPYTEEQWLHIQALGRLVDERLTAMDVRLSQGGEPTFVSVDDMNAPEWSTAALGAHKRERAEVLVRRLKERFAAGGLLHTAQGKWYPGEPLPRWALGVYWRRDGVPVWKEPRLLAEAHRDYGHGVAEAKAFSANLALALGLSPRYVTPAYEDALYNLLKEAELPAGIDPTKADLEDPAERRSLAERLSRGLDVPTGFVMPLAWDSARNRWHSAPWVLRRERLYLVPGDSPMGLRLPIQSLPWRAEDEQEAETDPFAPHPPLSDFHGEVAARYSRIDVAPDWHPEIREQRYADRETVSVEVPHTAVTVEARGGCLHVFLPPLYRLEHALELIAAVEHTATVLDLPVAVDGYPPPSDGRMEKLMVTPDPGVIEVNIHPALTWDQLEASTVGLYEDARLSRLGTEKFMLDGRHTGTGGGNHVTLGGPTPTDSPFLRRPDLLRSLVTYWQHHPALSYLFSGLFVGPTSQAPRVDEGRAEALYELEIAFQHVPAGGTPQPWLVDRLFRNLLVDITGNTHRSEFCIDKLYSPDSASGRQGLVEFRAFEMPPHARMSLAQMLLLRALVARFWREPLCAPARALGHRAARPLHAAAFPLVGPRGRAARARRRRLSLPARLARALPRVPLPPLRRAAPGGGGAGAAGGDRAMAGARRRDDTARHCPLRRLLRGTPAGAAQRHDRGPPRPRLQRPARAAQGHRDGGRGSRRRTLPRVAAALGPAPHDRRALAVGVRRRRHMERPLHRRLHLPRDAPGRPQLRALPRQRLRGRGAPRHPLQCLGPHAGQLHAAAVGRHPVALRARRQPRRADGPAGRRADRRVSAHPGPAAPRGLSPDPRACRWQP